MRSSQRSRHSTIASRANHSWNTEIERRTFLKRQGVGLGTAALASLLQRESASAGGIAGAAGGLPNLPVKAKRVIFLCMAGGPSHLETFDYKPQLDAMSGQPMPASFTEGQPIAQLQGQELRVQGHLCKFQQHGDGGQWISDFLPWHAKMADDICILKSMLTEQINHDPAHTFMNTGTAISGRPSMGAHGSIMVLVPNRTDDLPGFVVLTSIGGRNPTADSLKRQWSAGFLPSRYQGSGVQCLRGSGSLRAAIRQGRSNPAEQRFPRTMQFSQAGSG